MPSRLRETDAFLKNTPILRYAKNQKSYVFSHLVASQPNKTYIKIKLKVIAFKWYHGCWPTSSKLDPKLNILVKKTVKKRMFPMEKLIFWGSQAQFWCFSEPTRCAEHRCIKIFSKNSISEKSIFHRGTLMVFFGIFQKCVCFSKS